MPPSFIFSTGIENSNPTIDQGKTRIDEFEKCGHYKYWQTDFDLVQEMGIRVLRYGPPIHRCYLGAARYDWSFADDTFNDLQRRNLVPIADYAISACRTGSELPESRFPRTVCRLRARIFPALSMGSAVYAD